jgi:hypothetical protein
LASYSDAFISEIRKKVATIIINIQELKAKDHLLDKIMVHRILIRCKLWNYRRWLRYKLLLNKVKMLKDKEGWLKINILNMLKYYHRWMQVMPIMIHRILIEVLKLI